jgi:hypothetical protein
VADIFHFSHTNLTFCMEFFEKFAWFGVFPWKNIPTYHEKI